MLLGVTWNVYSYLMVKFILWHTAIVVSMKECTVRLRVHIPWIRIFLDSRHSHVSPTKTSIQTTFNFSWIYVCASYLLPWLYIGTECKLACCCHFQVLSLGKREIKLFVWCNFVSAHVILQLEGCASRVMHSHLCKLGTWPCVVEMLSQCCSCLVCLFPHRWLLWN